MKGQGMFILHIQLHGRWLANKKSQGISSHCIDLILMEYSRSSTRRVNTLKPRQNGCHFPDDIFKSIFLNENVWILIEISLKFVPKCPIINIPALGQIMAWRRTGNMPLSEPMKGNDVIGCWRIYTSLGPNELTHRGNKGGIRCLLKWYTF